MMEICRMGNYISQVTRDENYITGNIRLLDFKALQK